MGADILLQLPRWRRWREIVRLLPFAVLPRPGYNAAALAGQAAQLLRSQRHRAREACMVVRHDSGWVFLVAPQDTTSATAIRAAREGAVS
jgi:nicotinate-nucleotide adenylyltransferase